MLEVNSPIGNIFLNEETNNMKNEEIERLKISRLDLEKKILRKKTELGTDVGFNLDPGVKLQNGDYFTNGNMKIVIEQLPEKVICVRLKNKNNFEVMVLLGHIIGNRHRPIVIQKEEIVFPIQADSEKEVFTNLFHSIIDHIEITVKEQVFYPSPSADVHEH